MTTENKSSEGAQLRAIWERALSKSALGMEENFFELGGNPWLAIQLFREIDRVFGRKLTPLFIFQAPTIASLSKILESRKAPALASVLKLKNGTQAQAVFITHGLGGNVMDLFGLAQLVQTPFAVYGLQARGTDGVEKPCSSIEEMAGFHLQGVRTIQPRGPYILIGYSLGGSVAWEMSRQLSGQSERVALVMIDSYPALRHSPRLQRLRVHARRVWFLLKDIAQAGKKKVLWYFNSRNLHHSADHKISNLPSQDYSSAIQSLTPALKLVEASARLAWERYNPSNYPGEVRFIRASVSRDFPGDPVSLWGPRAGRFEVETVGGIHHELLTKNCQALADVVSKQLKELTYQMPAGT